MPEMEYVGEFSVLLLHFYVWGSQMNSTDTCPYSISVHYWEKKSWNWRNKEDRIIAREEAEQSYLKRTSMLFLSYIR